MSILQVIIIGIALAMDAFGASLGIGVNGKIKRKQKIWYLLSFSFFQFLFIFAGGMLGAFCNIFLVQLSGKFGSLVVAIVGILMIIDGLKAKEESVICKNSMIFILGISVSIDALVVGFTIFNDIGGIITIMINSIFVGLITLFMCTIAFFICRYIRKINFVKKYASLFGGIALIGLAINMFL